MSRAMIDKQPWYRQFWPWFLISLPASVVIAGTTMVFVAFKHADTLVSDNYYKDGLAINQTLAQDTRAAELGLAARIAFDGVSGEVFVTLESNRPWAGALELLLLHPVDESSDRRIALQEVGPGRYRADLEDMPGYRYYLRLQPASAADWRLRGELDFARQTAVTLNPDV